jgi:putative tricarboxylic transport membrane protein
MRPYRQFASLLFAVLGAFLIIEGFELRLQGDFGPGPGFMAVLIGALLLACSVGWGVRESLAPSEGFPAELLPDREGLQRVLVVTAAMLVLVAVLTSVGFKLSLFLFLLVTQFVFGQDRPVVKVLVALACSFGVFLLFERVLRVPLPDPSIDWLAALGF